MGLVSLAGAMQRSLRTFRMASMLVRNGVIGDVREIDCNYGRPGYKPDCPPHSHRFLDNAEVAAIESAPNADVKGNVARAGSMHAAFRLARSA